MTLLELVVVGVTLFSMGCALAVSGYRKSALALIVLGSAMLASVHLGVEEALGVQPAAAARAGPIP